MVRAASNAEYLLTRQAAEEYRNQGYEVTLEAPLDFFPGFHADLLARKNNEVRVIEVKSRSSLNAVPQLAELVQIIDSKPGWDFELLLVVVPRDVVYSRDAGVVPPMPPCGHPVIVIRKEARERFVAVRGWRSTVAE